MDAMDSSSLEDLPIVLAGALTEEQRVRLWLHRRLQPYVRYRRIAVGRWSFVRHWGHCRTLGRCPSCPCCRSVVGRPGCVACDATTQAVSIASKIAGFCGVHPACRIRAASKSNGFLQLPPVVIKLIGEMLPTTPLHATLLSTRLPWLSLRPRLFPPA